MAESFHEGTINNIFSRREPAAKFECAVCLQTCVHPSELPCGHIFCYLCIKGIVNQGKRCAMCRQEIPDDYLEKPRLINPFDVELITPGFEDGYLWFYEGRNGWWQYEERTCLELESAYRKGERCCDLLIAGFLYVADFDGMVQYRKNDPSKRRKIIRDHATTTKKGIAGIKIRNCNLTASNSPEVPTNSAIQSLPASNPSILNSLSNFSVLSSDSNNCSQYAESAVNPQRLSGSSNACSLSNSITSSSISNPISSDTALRDTVDWTIEQMESLSLELSGDYEALCRDVNNCETLQGNLNQSRFRRIPNNFSRYRNVTNPVRHPDGNEMNFTDTVPDSAQSINNGLNNFSLASSVSMEETNPVYSEVTESVFDKS